MQNVFEFISKHSVTIEALSAFGTFIATSILIIVAYWQLKSLNVQSKADFLFRFNRDFFYDNKTIQKIIKTIDAKKPLFKENGGQFDEYQIDDYLGYFELMQLYLDKKLIAFNLVDQMFGYYIARAWENNEIKTYVTNLRKDMKDPRYYEPFEKLAKAIKKEEDKINKEFME
jgi:hypothetical protein